MIDFTLGAAALACFVNMVILLLVATNPAGRLDEAEAKIEDLKWKLGTRRLLADLELDSPTWAQARPHQHFSDGA